MMKNRLFLFGFLALMTVSSGFMFADRTRKQRTFGLSGDVYEDNGNVIAKMDVPGIDAGKISISIEGKSLRVYGERGEKEEQRGRDYYKKEIKYGNFERILSLPCLVDESKTTAELHDGVLTVTMPKIKEDMMEKSGNKITVVRL